MKVRADPRLCAQTLHFKQSHTTEWDRKCCQRYSATLSKTRGRALQAALKAAQAALPFMWQCLFFAPELSGQCPSVTQSFPQQQWQQFTHWMHSPCRTVTLFSWTFVGVVVLLLFSRCWRRLAASCSSWTNVLEESMTCSCVPPFLTQIPAFPLLAPNSPLTPPHLPRPLTAVKGPLLSTLPTHPTFPVPLHHYNNNLMWFEVSNHSSSPHSTFTRSAQQQLLSFIFC